MFKSLCVTWLKQWRRGPKQHLSKKVNVSLKRVGRGRCPLTWKLDNIAPLELGRLRRSSTRRVTGSLGHSSRATGSSQKSAGCVGCVHQVCRLKSGVQMGRSLPLRVWPHVNGGCIEGALGPGCRSRTPLAVPRTESSVPCCVAAVLELFIECRRQSVQTWRVGASCKDQRGSSGFCGCRSRARLRVPRMCHSCEDSRRANSFANDKYASWVRQKRPSHHTHNGTRGTLKIVLQCQNQDALRSAFWEPATSQNNAGFNPANYLTAYSAKNLGLTLGVMQTGSQTQRSPNAPSFEERLIEWNLRVEEMARTSVWTLHKSAYKIPGSFSANRH